MPARRGKRQSQLTFTPVPSSSPSQASRPAATRERAAFVTIDGLSSPMKTSRTVKGILATPRPSADDDDGVDGQSHGRASSSRKMKTPHAHKFMAGPTSSQSPRKINKRVIVISDESESDDDDDALPSSMMQSSPSTLSTQGAKLRRTIIKSDTDSEEVPRIKDQVQDEESDEDLPLPSSRRMRSVTSQGGISQRFAKRKLVQLSDSEEEEEEDDDDDEGDTPMSSRRSTRSAKKQKTQHPSDTDVEEESEEDAITVDNWPHRHIKSAPERVAVPLTNKDKADLDADLEFLEDADSSHALRHAPTSTKKQNRLSQLDELKALRGQKQSQLSQGPSIIRSSPLTRNTRRISLSESEDEIEEILDDDNYGDEEMATDDDFIVEDEEDQEPVALPGEFSRYNKEKPKELFKYVVEWMVSKKINPAFAMTDEVYDIAFRRLNGFVRGMGGSKFHSSAWGAAFGKSLNSRPLLEDVRVGASIMHDKCDACNRSGHPATWEVKFTGNTYDMHTLEKNEEGVESDDSDTERSAPDVPSAETVYYIGKICMRNARTAHAFAHWKYHLNEWVVDHLKDIQELTPAKIIERDSWSTKRRRKDAERIVDQMESSGEIKRLHRDFKMEIDTAQLANNTSSRRQDISSP